MEYYRIYLQRQYSDITTGSAGGWVESSVEFIQQSPDSFMEQQGWTFRIRLLHIISEDDWQNKRLYSIPLREVKFY
jgi:hypothetical protein